MWALSTAEWLSMWEAGLLQQPAEWVLTLLAGACPGVSADTLAQLSIGQRDERLLALRESLFGSQVASLTECPECGEQLELTFNAADIRAESQVNSTGSYALSQGEWQVHFRLPTSLDMLSIANEQEPEAIRHVLFQRCILHAEQNGVAMSADRLPEQVVNDVVARMAHIDPQADVQLTLTCPACTHRWQASFDIVRFLWSELDAWAIRTLRAVHSLASAYGWREADILAMNPWRRQLYLEMIG
jgi:hypothetical protein